MAYNHGQYQVTFPSGMTATASGNKAGWTPGYMPHHVRAAGIVVTTSGSTTSGAVFAFLHDSLASGSTPSDLAVLTLTSGTAGTAPIYGDVVVKDGINVKVNPGERVILNVRTAVTGVSGFRGFLWVEPTWEVPENMAKVHRTT